MAKNGQSNFSPRDGAGRRSSVHARSRATGGRARAQQEREPQTQQTRQTQQAHQSQQTHQTLQVRQSQRERALTEPPQAVPDHPMTIGEIINYWLENRMDRIKPSSVSYYRLIAKRHILPELSSLAADDLTPEALAEHLESKRLFGRKDGTGGLSAKTVNELLLMIRASMHFAEEENLIHGVVGLDKVKPVPRERLERKIEVFSPAETARMTEAIIKEPNLENIAFLLALDTGMRLGELCGLRWSDIDFEAQWLSVRRTAIRVNNIGKTELLIQTPKTATSSRSIPLTEEHIRLLQMFRPEDGSDAYIFSRNGQQPLDPRSMQLRFEHFLRSLGIRLRRFHTLRHSFATRSVERGVDVKTVSELLGHSSVRITLEMYTHPTMEAKRRCMEQVSILNKNSSKDS